MSLIIKSAFVALPRDQSQICWWKGHFAFSPQPIRCDMDRHTCKICIKTFITKVYLFVFFFVRMKMITWLVESQKGILNIQRCSIGNQKGAIAVQSLWCYNTLLVLSWRLDHWIGLEDAPFVYCTRLQYKRSIMKICFVNPFYLHIYRNFIFHGVFQNELFFIFFNKMLIWSLNWPWRCFPGKQLFTFMTEALCKISLASIKKNHWLRIRTT